MCQHWRRHHFVIENGLVRPGLNRLTLTWPALPAEGDAAIGQILARLEQGVPTELHPIFGKLFALDAQPAHWPHFSLLDRCPTCVTPLITTRSEPRDA